MRGFLCINKSAGATSRDAVNTIQRLVHPKKVGHAGTLDPLATGVLVVAVGQATRLIQFVQRMPKTYVASFELGKTSDTEDITGEVESHHVELPPSSEEVLRATKPFIGEILQQPPIFSALHVGGKRAHSLARKGEHVELSPRPVVVHQIDIIAYQFPRLELQIVCGSGTYVRSIGRDIGEALGCGAVMTELVRTSIGSFHVKDSYRAEDFSNEDEVVAALKPPAVAVSQLPRVVVDAEQARLLSFGQKVSLTSNLPSDSEQLAAFDEEQHFLAVLVRTDEDYKPAINFAARTES